MKTVQFSPENDVIPFFIDEEEEEEGEESEEGAEPSRGDNDAAAETREDDLGATDDDTATDGGGGPRGSRADVGGANWREQRHTYPQGRGHKVSANSADLAGGNHQVHTKFGVLSTGPPPEVYSNPDSGPCSTGGLSYPNLL